MKPPTPCKAIHAYCMTRCLQSAREVTKCADTECPLYRFRMANNPNRKRAYLASKIEKDRNTGKITRCTTVRKSTPVDVSNKTVIMDGIEYVLTRKKESV
jgi:hypothetical protein